jgi:hypothetical protein
MDEETFERITAIKAKEKGSERIQLLEGSSSVPDTTGNDEGKAKKDDTVQRKASVKKAKKTAAAVSEEKTTATRMPKHEFRIVKSEKDGKRSSFVMTISLPEEVSVRQDVAVFRDWLMISQVMSLEDNMDDIDLSLTPDHLDFTSKLYSLSTALPRDIDVDSVLKGGAAVEWSVEDKALRIQGLLKQ